MVAGATRNQLINSLSVLCSLQAVLKKLKKVSDDWRKEDLTYPILYVLADFGDGIEKSIKTNAKNIKYVKEQLDDLINLEELMKELPKK